MNNAIRRLDDMLAWLRGINGAWRVEVGAPPAERAKLGYLAASGRDLLQPSPKLAAATATAVDATLRTDQAPRAEATLRAVGEAIKAVVVERASGGGDAQLRPPKPSTAQAKRRRGLAPHPAGASGQLLAALRAATFTLRRSTR